MTLPDMSPETPPRHPDTNATTYEIVRVTPDRIADLVDLTRAVYGVGASVSNDLLAAKFNTAPFGAAYVGYIAYPSRGTAAAYYGVFPTVARFGLDEVLCAQSGDTMTHPDHRGKGLFIDLARKTYATAREEGIQFVFGFPSPASFPGFSRKLSWTFPFAMVRFTRFVPTLPVGAIRQRLKRPSRGFGHVGKAIAGRLFDVVQPQGPLWTDDAGRSAGVVRDQRFWRYKESGTLFVQFETLGTALKFDGDLHIGEIVGDATEARMRRLMRRLDVFAGLTGALRVKSYFSPRSRLEQLLAPFGRRTPSLPYGFVNFSGHRDPATLDLSYIDYDTF